MEFPWKRSGQDSNASVILGSGSEGIASETEGDQLSRDQMLCNLRMHMCCTAGAAKHMGEMICLHVFMHHMQTRAGYLMCFLHLRERPEAFC